jgi:hypothetical protein
MSLDDNQWIKEIESHREFFQTFGSELPTEFISKQDHLKIKFLNHLAANSNTLTGAAVQSGPQVTPLM